MTTTKPTEAPQPAATEATQNDPRTGRFLPGNSGFGGRPKGARNKLTTEFFDDLYATWQEHGGKALKIVATKHPKDFAKIMASLMPKEFEIKTPLDDMSDGELADLIAAVQSLVAGGVALASAGGERPALKPHKAPSLRAVSQAG